jgi:hypothetical protein
MLYKKKKVTLTRFASFQRYVILPLQNFRVPYPGTLHSLSSRTFFLLSCYCDCRKLRSTRPGWIPVALRLYHFFLKSVTSINERKETRITERLFNTESRLNRLHYSCPFVTCVVQNEPLFSFSVWFVSRELSYAFIWPYVLYVCFFVGRRSRVGWRKVYNCIIAQVALNKFTALLGCVNVGGREISVCRLSYATFTALYHRCSVSSCGDANKNYYVVVDNFFCTQGNANNCDWYVLNTSGLIFREDDAKHLCHIC